MSALQVRKAVSQGFSRIGLTWVISPIISIFSGLAKWVCILASLLTTLSCFLLSFSHTFLPHFAFLFFKSLIFHFKTLFTKTKLMGGWSDNLLPSFFLFYVPWVVCWMIFLTSSKNNCTPNIHLFIYISLGCGIGKGGTKLRVTNRKQYSFNPEEYGSWGYICDSINYVFSKSNSLCIANNNTLSIWHRCYLRSWMRLILVLPLGMEGETLSLRIAVR